MAVRHDVGSVARIERTPQGGLRVHAHVTRTGVLEYRRADGSVRREWRPAEEVFSADSIATLDDAPFTVEHPRGLLSPEDYEAHSVGHVRDPRRDESAIAATVIVQSKRGLSAIRSGLREVSCGYACRLDETPGVTPDGEHYDAVQRDIRYNHVSLVPRGRAGATVRLRMDSTGDTILDNEEPLMIRIDGKDFPLDSDAERKAAADALALYAAKRDAECASEKARADAAESKVATFEAAEKERADAAIKATCARVLGKEGTPADVIAKVLPSVKLDGRDDASIALLFEAAVTHFDAQSKADPDGIATVRKALVSSEPVRTDSAEKFTADDIRKRSYQELIDASSKPLAVSK